MSPPTSPKEKEPENDDEPFDTSSDPVLLEKALDPDWHPNAEVVNQRQKELKQQVRQERLTKEADEFFKKNPEPAPDPAEVNRPKSALEKLREASEERKKLFLGSIFDDALDDFGVTSGPQEKREGTNEVQEVTNESTDDEDMKSNESSDEGNESEDEEDDEGNPESKEGEFPDEMFLEAENSVTGPGAMEDHDVDYDHYDDTIFRDYTRKRSPVVKEMLKGLQSMMQYQRDNHKVEYKTFILFVSIPNVLLISRIIKEYVKKWKFDTVQTSFPTN